MNLTLYKKVILILYVNKNYLLCMIIDRVKKLKQVNYIGSVAQYLR